MGRQVGLLAQVVAALAGTLIISASLNAHEFWIMMSAPQLAPAGTAALSVGFGEQFPFPTPLPEAGEVPIRVFSPSGAAIPLRSRSQITPEGFLAGTFPGGTEAGVYVVDASLYAKAVDYTAAEFQDYLTRERMSSALGFRKALREETRDAREIVTMFAKAFVRVGRIGAVPQRIQTRMELVTLTDPTVVRVGSSFRFRVLSTMGDCQTR